MESEFVIRYTQGDKAQGDTAVKKNVFAMKKTAFVLFFVLLLTLACTVFLTRTNTRTIRETQSPPPLTLTDTANLLLLTSTDSPPVTPGADAARGTRGMGRRTRGQMIDAAVGSGEGEGSA